MTEPGFNGSKKKRRRHTMVDPQPLYPTDERPSLVIELRTRTVILELTCADHYSAIALHDELMARGREAGLINLAVGGIQARWGGGAES
jgi:hypothetical protein